MKEEKNREKAHASLNFNLRSRKKKRHWDKRYRDNQIKMISCSASCSAFYLFKHHFAIQNLLSRFGSERLVKTLEDCGHVSPTNFKYKCCLNAVVA